MDPATAPVAGDAGSALAWRALDALPLGVIIVDDRMCPLWRNRAAAGVTGALAADEDWLAALAGAPAASRWRDEIKSAIESGAGRVLGAAVPHGQAASEGAWRVSVEPVELKPGRRGALLLMDTEGSGSAGGAAGAEASRHLSALGSVAARLAHEINSPLDGSYRFVNLGLRLAREAGMGQIEDCLSESATAHRRMMRVVSDLLDYARRPQERSEATDLNALTAEVLRSVTDRAAQRRVLVVSDLSEPMPRVDADALYPVLSNLVRNALDAMPAGGTLTVTTRNHGHRVVILVEDTGHGLPPDPQRVFEPYYTTKPRGEGTGLGLAICREIVTQRLGGSITARPRPGRGATFEVQIPLERGSTTAPEASA